MKMKKLLALLLAVVMIFGITACGKTEEASPEEPAPSTDEAEPAEPSTDEAEPAEPSAEKKTMGFLWNETDSTQVDTMENYIMPALAEKFPNIEFELIPVTDIDAVKTLCASGDLPEIFYTSGAGLDSILAANAALDLAPYIDQSWLDENFKDPSQVFLGDAVYFLAAGENEYYSPCFYYNVDVFNELGLSEPKSLDELVSVSQTLVDNGYKAVTTSALTAAWSMIDGFLAGGDVNLIPDLADGKCDWTDERVKTALSYFDQLKLSGALADDIASKDDATALAEFQSGEAAMWLTYSWTSNDALEENIGFPTAMFPWPADLNGNYMQLTFGTRKGAGGGYTANAEYEDPQLLAEIMKVIVEACSDRHAANGIHTNFIVDNPPQPANELEATRLAYYDMEGAARHNVLVQGAMDGVTIAEFHTLVGMLLSDDDSYLSANFIDEFNQVWLGNTYIDFK